MGAQNIGWVFLGKEGGERHWSNPEGGPANGGVVPLSAPPGAPRRRRIKGLSGRHSATTTHHGAGSGKSASDGQEFDVHGEEHKRWAREHQMVRSHGGMQPNAVGGASRNAPAAPHSSEGACAAAGRRARAARSSSGHVRNRDLLDPIFIGSTPASRCERGTLAVASVPVRPSAALAYWCRQPGCPVELSDVLDVVRHDEKEPCDDSRRTPSSTSGRGSAGRRVARQA